ncbi:MAG: NHLP bacteriocin system secretion protein [Aphanothece sp. CMT-3BRIN-NPC111]|jgi:hypothetical protein|nr:NHLP bacteriocin system secretion protein [Aphanothece sp. CMT-3BRIN-NPC111]
MFDQKRSLFRKESLERLSSPERLDQLMQVVSPKDWLALATLGGFVFLALIWSIFGRIPVTVTGQGVLIEPRRVGQLQSLNVGDERAIEQNIEAKEQASQIVGITYFALKDGKQIQPGMQIQITPDTVQRERFGAMVGKITSVSTLPVTKERATSMLGNQELVENLISQGGPKIEAIAQLELNPSTFSGYKWSSSKGPKLKISPGTTTTARVTIEELAPITFVLPILREWSGLN